MLSQRTRSWSRWPRWCWPQRRWHEPGSPRQVCRSATYHRESALACPRRERAARTRRDEALSSWPCDHQTWAARLWAPDTKTGTIVAGSDPVGANPHWPYGCAKLGAAEGIGGEAEGKAPARKSAAADASPALAHSHHPRAASGRGEPHQQRTESRKGTATEVLAADYIMAETEEMTGSMETE
jgi:hypothetical protein